MHQILLASNYLLTYLLYMKQSQQPTQSRKPTQVRRQEIVEAGMRILASDGARQFTAARLGAAVGITGGTIFRHFESMDEILDAIVDRIEEILFGNFPLQADDPLESLRRFFEARVQVISSHPEISKLLLTSTLIPSANAEYRQERLQEFKRRSRRLVINHLTDASRSGLLAGDIHPDEGAILVLGCIHAIGHMGIRTGAAPGASELAPRIWRLIEKTLTGGVG